MAEGLLAVGFVLIGVALVGSSEELSFSDVNTLLPCIGTALAIHAGRARLLGAVLRHPLAVGIGLISYSLYLVHWPLIVLVKYNHFEPFSAVERLALLAAAVALATALYHGIEKPLRARDRSSADARTDRRFVAGCASATMGVSAVALGVWFDGGLLHRYPLPVREQLRPEHMLSHRDYTWPRFTRLEHTFNAGPQRKVLVVGDSQAADFVNLLGESGVLDQVDVQAVRLDRQCQSLISLSRREFDALGAQDQATCSAYFARWIELRDLARADVAVLAFNWYERGLPSIEAAVVALTARGVRQVVIVGRKSQGYSGFDVLQQRGTGAAAQAFSAHHRNAIAWRVNEQLQALPRHFEWVDTMTPICPSADVCHVFDETGRVLFFDSSHLTPAGARFLGQRLRDSGALDAIAPRHAGGATAARS
jgi:hypothetical protein